MAIPTDKALPGTLSEAVKSDPHENARRAEALLDSPRRREQEAAMRNKEKATRTGDDGLVRDSAVKRPAD